MHGTATSLTFSHTPSSVFLLLKQVIPMYGLKSVNMIALHVSRVFERMSAADSSRFLGTLETFSFIQFETSARSNSLDTVVSMRGCRDAPLQNFFCFRNRGLELN